VYYDKYDLIIKCIIIKYIENNTIYIMHTSLNNYALLVKKQTIIIIILKNKKFKKLHTI